MRDDVNVLGWLRSDVLCLDIIKKCHGTSVAIMRTGSGPYGPHIFNTIHFHFETVQFE